ncbi:hypothetical protein CAC42_5353 [Sphaceloma murrayae]|uniref:Elongator complex protein 4 n=1 Tax=Sphaceloma murrayae TaxID=2082308 RepID=A0A2K1QUS1_9PEZI|nr:hypothetical protein CAC42_5353 [Sphaceloma murrayae]
MAFRKRNVGIQRASGQQGGASVDQLEASASVSISGVRPSPLTGQPTTSTGITSLDGYLGGHGGLPTGSSVLIEESGTTDFSGAILKFFAAEGITQAHHLHVVGLGDQWIRDLPGVAGAAESVKSQARPDDGLSDKMKIAWRYQRLGQHDSAQLSSLANNRMPIAPGVEADTDNVFCHIFDLAKRLDLPPSASIHHVPMTPLAPISKPPFADILRSISLSIEDAPKLALHRILIPSILSPAFYPPHAGIPEHFLQFLHSLRALLRKFPDRVVAMITIPTELHKRASGLVRWAEQLCDGVMELQPFPHIMDASNSLAESGGARSGEEQPQGMLKFHKLPGLTERGATGVLGIAVGDDLSFTLSRRKFLIRPFSLPPMEQEVLKESVDSSGSRTSALSSTKKADIEF